MSTYGQFEKLATENGVCIAGVKTVIGEKDPTATNNVTKLFTSASDETTYFTAKPCNPKSNVLGRMTKSGHFVHSLECFLFAPNAVYEQLCLEQVDICEEFYMKGCDQISKIFKKLKLNTTLLSTNLCQTDKLESCRDAFHQCADDVKSMKISYSMIGESSALVDFGLINSRAMALANMELCTSSKNNSNVARSTGSTALSDNQTVLPSYQGNQSLELSLLMGLLELLASTAIHNGHPDCAFCREFQFRERPKWLTEEFASVIVLGNGSDLYFDSTTATVIVLELFLCASILLGFIFGPKIYMMLSYEPAVVEMRPQKIVKDFVNFWKSLELRKSHTHSTCSVVNCKNSSTYTRANCRVNNQLIGINKNFQIPIFYIVMRRNNHLERSHSADRKSCGRIIEQITMPSEMLCHDKKKENGDQFHKHGTYI
ncbi:unnamed protein product [Wuchereria bancrofti]|uniref:Uncharacterized protein n=1 Tax=Wuchereria bancrofti TaxID=6293 RepID=A0A3P7FHL4_WUCBA|nr:unnamed protein product [Wuchereria bancrofti]